MNFNVPGSSCPEDEFRFPGGGWCSIHRCITFNSALTWKDALPGTASLRGLLTTQHVRSIAHLARLLHQAERQTGDPKGVRDTPFEVLRWWDPTDRDWHHGRRCCLRLRAIPLMAFLQALPADQVRSAARNGDTLEVIIPKLSDRCLRLGVNPLRKPGA